MKTAAIINKLVVYIPETTEEDPQVDAAIKRLIQLAGGATKTQAVGVWEGRQERTTVLTVYHGSDWFQDATVRGATSRLVEEMLRAGEEAVLVEYNGGAVLYEDD